MATVSDALVALRDGPAVPESVVLWLLGAEDRGLRFRVEPDGALHVSPRTLVQPDDLAFVRAHRDVLLTCVAYIERIAREPLA